MEENKEKEKDSNETQQTEPAHLSLEDIIKEGENIYPVSEESDKKCIEIHKIKNWAEMFYNIKQEKSKSKFNELMSKSEYSKFFEGLNYEYGINNYTQDTQKAFDIYKEAADNTVDAMSMYKMYHIYKNEYKKFNIEKRSRIYEKYYLYKCFAYLSYQELKRNTFLCNRFDVVLEIVIQFDQEDQNFDKLKNFLMYLKKYYKELNIRERDVFVIESVFNFKFGNEIQNMKNAIQQLRNLIPSNDDSTKSLLELEIYYKIACYLLEVNEIQSAEYYFSYVVNAQYYRAFPDFALFLSEKKNEPRKALVILRIASENGYNNANIMYYNIFLNSFDFNKMNKDDEIIKDFIKTLFNLLVNNFVTEDVYSFFEYFYLRKILIKKFGFKNLLDEFSDYTKEFTEFIVKMANPDSKEDEQNDYFQSDNNKELILEYFQRNEFYPEFNLVCGFLYYYGIENVLEKDYVKSLEKFKIAYKSSNSKSYKRFCYSYIYKIRDKLNKKGLINPKNKSLIVSDNKLMKTKKKLFQMYKTSVEEDDFVNLSSSFFYYLSRLFNKKIGNNGDTLLEFICLQRAIECNNETPIFGSSICYYRRKKAMDLINNEDKYNTVLEGIHGIKDSEGYGEDNSLCPICFDQKRNILCLPCKHLFCINCLKKIANKRKCPICRGSIIITCNTQFKKTEEPQEKKEKTNVEDKNEKNENAEEKKEKTENIEEKKENAESVEDKKAKVENIEEKGKE